jgi:hypothetical protein
MAAEHWTCWWSTAPSPALAYLLGLSPSWDSWYTEGATSVVRSAEFEPPGQRSGWRYEQLGFVLAGLTAAVTAAVQTFGKIKGAPLWMFIALYAAVSVLAGGTALVKLRSMGAAENREWVEQVKQLLKEHPTGDGRLPRLSSLSPYRLGSPRARTAGRISRAPIPT